MYLSTAELYGSAAMNAQSGSIANALEKGYHAGTGYNEGGLIHMDKFGAGVLGQSGGYYWDEAGQYTMDVHGNIQYNDPTGRDSQNPLFNDPKTSPQITAYDDWNQHGIVMTGSDLIAYTTGFDASLSTLAPLAATSVYWASSLIFISTETKLTNHPLVFGKSLCTEQRTAMARESLGSTRSFWI